MSQAFIDLILSLTCKNGISLYDSDFRIFIDAPMDFPARVDILLDNKIKPIAFIDPSFVSLIIRASLASNSKHRDENVTSLLKGVYELYRKKKFRTIIPSEIYCE